MIKRPVVRFSFGLLYAAVALVLEFEAIANADLASSVLLNSAFLLVVFSELIELAKPTATSVAVYELNKLQRYAELGRVTSGFIHDLSNPLTAVTLNLENLQAKHRLSEVEHALKSTEIMRLYVKAARSQIRGDQVDESFSVRQIISNVEHMTAYTARQHNVTLKVDCPVDLLFYGNPVRFQQAVSNLVSNALDAYRSYDCPERVVLIMVRDTEANLSVRVEDTGPGIKPSNLGQIFRPFFTTKLADHGSGLGLSITKGIVEDEFGGTITAKSRVGRGTTFCLTLPKKRA